MFKPKESSQSEFEFVSINEMVPDDHLLHLIDKNIDFSFLLEKVRPFYGEDNGRPSDCLIPAKPPRSVNENTFLFPFNRNTCLFRQCMEEYKHKVRVNRLSKSGKLLYKFRKEKIERSFAAQRAARTHYCRVLRLKNPSEHALLTAAFQNIKRLHHT